MFGACESNIQHTQALQLFPFQLILPIIHTNIDSESPIKPGSVAVLREYVSKYKIPGGVKCTVTGEKNGFYSIDIEEYDTLLKTEFCGLQVSHMQLIFLCKDQVVGVPTYTTSVTSAEDLKTYNMKYNQAALMQGIQDVMSLQAPRPAPFQSSMKLSQKLGPQYSSFLQQKEKLILPLLANLKDDLSHCTRLMLWELTYTDADDESGWDIEGEGAGVWILIGQFEKKWDTFQKHLQLIRNKFRDSVGRELFNYPPGSHLICILGENPQTDDIGLDCYIHDCKIQEHSQFSSCLYKTGLHMETINLFFEEKIKYPILQSATVVPSSMDENRKGIQTLFLYNFWENAEDSFDDIFTGIFTDVSNSMTHQKP